MTLDIKISKSADFDLNSIWKYTHDEYGQDQAYRYLGLINVALDDIAKEPESIVARRVQPQGKQLYVRPLTASKRPGTTDVRSPRHVIVYTLEFEGIAYILRVLHDSMDISKHLEPDLE